MRSRERGVKNRVELIVTRRKLSHNQNFIPHEHFSPGARFFPIRPRIVRILCVFRSFEPVSSPSAA